MKTNRQNNPVGFLDSGVGGLCVRDAFCARLPCENTIYLADSSHCPYGNQESVVIRARVFELVNLLMEREAKMIVLACNTATAAAIDDLRECFPNYPFVGMEPAVKPAALRTKTGVVGVLATAGTFSGRLYRETCARFAAKTTVLACVADDFVALVEKGETTGARAREAVRRRVEPLLAAGADHIVLGCTHFPHLKPLIEEVVAGRASILDPAPAVAQQAERLLKARNLLRSAQTPPTHTLERL